MISLWFPDLSHVWKTSQWERSLFSSFSSLSSTRSSFASSFVARWTTAQSSCSHEQCHPNGPLLPMRNDMGGLWMGLSFQKWALHIFHFQGVRAFKGHNCSEVSRSRTQLNITPLAPKSSIGSRFSFSKQFSDWLLQPLLKIFFREHFSE